MAGVRKPSRSDELNSIEEQLEAEQKIKDQFDAIAPERHTKPQRSDYSNQYTDTFHYRSSGADIPEYTKFQELESHSDKFVYTDGGATEDFVETQYYKDLNTTDKQHHTTGTGFIKVEKSNSDADFRLRTEEKGFDHHTTKGNPATNDWIPSAETVFPTSDKPQRSES